jgi:hypothetical protein
MASALKLYNYRIMIMMMETKVEKGSHVATNLPETTKNLPEIPESTNSNCCKKFSHETLERILLVSITAQCSAQRSNYIVGAITHLKLLDLSKFQISEKN